VLISDSSLPSHPFPCSLDELPELPSYSLLSPKRTTSSKSVSLGGLGAIVRVGKVKESSRLTLRNGTSMDPTPLAPTMGSTEGLRAERVLEGSWSTSGDAMSQ